MSSALIDAEFKLRMNAKIQRKSARKAKKAEEAYKKQLDQAMANNDVEKAKSIAKMMLDKDQTAARISAMADNIDRAVSRIEVARSMDSATRSAALATKSMEIAEKNMNPKRVTEIMERQQTVTENIEISSMEYEGAAENLLATTVDDDQIQQALNESRSRVLGGQLPDPEEGIEERENELTEKELKAQQEREREQRMEEKLKELRQLQAAS